MDLQVCFDLAERKREFFYFIKEAFEPFIKSDNEQDTFDWELVRTFYKNYKRTLTNISSLRIFCQFVFELFFRFNCFDYVLIVKMIYIYRLVLNEYKSLALCNNCVQFSCPRHYYYEEFKDSRWILKSVNEVEEYLYGFSNRGLYSKLAISVTYEGDYVFLQFLIKYGLIYLPDDVVNQIEVELELLYRKYCCFKRPGGNDEMLERPDFVESISKLLLTDVENANLSRKLLIIRAVNIALCWRLGDNYYSDYAKCFNFYMLTVAEPVISMKDVEDFLEFAFADHPDSPFFIAETCASFKETFPENPKLSSPKSLKCLCRCRITDSIPKFPVMFVAAVSEMEIANCEKNFLLFMRN